MTNNSAPVRSNSAASRTAPPGSAGETVVDVRDLTFSYGDFTAVRKVDLTVSRGEIFALLGTNGAGKTTTLDLVQGYRRASSGTVRVLGVDPAARSRTLRRRTGVMLQQAGFLSELTVVETVRMWASLSSRSDTVEACLARVELEHRRDVVVAHLSGGERRRLDVALATWGGPDLVIMDEPTTGLDPASRRMLWHLVRRLRESGTSIMLTTHYLEEVEALADRLALMHEGEVVVAGTIEEVLRTRPSLITARVDAGVEPPALPGLTTSPTGEESGRTELHVECADLQESVRDLVTWAAREDVRLHNLRATSASLEDVFHAVRQENS